jgi:serine/threonine-protein kinase RsbW
MRESLRGEYGSVDGVVSCERRVALRNDLAEVARFGELLAQLAQRQRFNKKQFFAVRLCAEEALTNIISYAFADGSEHQIDVRVQVTPGEILLEILDDGRPFDPLKVPSPPMPGSVADLAVGGRGIHLMRSFSDRLQYERIHGQNRLTISVRRDE